MAARTGWTHQPLLVAFNLYCQMPFGKMHSRNPVIIKYAELIGRTPSALAMKLTNIASLDPAITSTGRKGRQGASAADKVMWEGMQADWELFVIKSHQATAEFEAPLTTLLYRMRLSNTRGVTKQLKQRLVLVRIFSGDRYLAPITFGAALRTGCTQAVGSEPHRSLAD
ncbi:MAG: hypothetical protein ACXWT3_08655 [Methylococcaceae bacterium]